VNRRPRCLLLCLAIVAGSFPAAAQGNALTTSTNAGQTTKPFTFEVVSIHPYASSALPYAAVEYSPDGLGFHGMSLGSLIRIIYSQPSSNSNLSTEVQNAPAWFYTDKYDIEARVAKEDQKAWQEQKNGISSPLARAALSAMLEDRAKLTVHLTTKQGNCLDLTVGSHGPRLQTAAPALPKIVPGKTFKFGDGISIQETSSERFFGVSMADLVQRLSRAASFQTIIQDKTGLTGRYDFTLPWYGDDPEIVGLDRMPVSGIGLVLKPGQAPVTVINIDHIERPDAN